MRVWSTTLFMAFLGAACACTSQATGDKAPSNPSTGGAGPGSGGATTGGGDGGKAGSPSSGGTTGANSGGASASGGATASGGAGGASASTGGTSGASSGGASGSGSGGTSSTPMGDASGGDPPSGPPMMGGKALLITGTIPIVGTDVQFEAAFKARGMEVEIVQEKAATPANAVGKRIIMLSYGMSSTAFNCEPFADVPVPIIVTEHNLLPRLKMSTLHNYTGKLTKLTIVSDHELAAGFPKGDLDVYGTAQEMFWGSPSPAGIKIANILGKPDQITFFAYEKGAMMDGLVAPAKRVQFFHASHSPDPIDKNLYLNANGLKLLGATIDWCLK